MAVSYEDEFDEAFIPSSPALIIISPSFIRIYVASRPSDLLY